MTRFLLPALALFLLPLTRAWAEVPAVLRAVPESAEVVALVEKPHQLFDAVWDHELIREVRRSDVVQALYRSTNTRRLQQFLAYLEKELARDYRQLLEDLGGDGLFLAARFSRNPAVLVGVQGQDERLTKRFTAMFSRLVEEELARQENPAALKQGNYRGQEGWRVGPIRVVRLESMILLSNEESFLKEAVDRVLDGKTSTVAEKAYQECRKLLPPDTRAWVWQDFKAALKVKDFAEGLKAAATDPFITLVLGGFVDVLRRTPSICFGLAEEKGNWHARLAMPCGRNGMGARSTLLMPAKGPGSLPPLQVPRALAAAGGYFDFGAFWTGRETIFNKKLAADLEKADRDLSKFLKTSLGDLLQQAGTHYRLVAAEHGTFPYKTRPTTPLPAFGLVLEPIGPDFARYAETGLRAAGLFGTFQYGLRMKEEDCRGHQLVSYFFKEGRQLAEDPGNFRFNFSPCFAKVGDRFVVASTSELGKNMIETLVDGPKDKGHAATTRTMLFGKGVAESLRVNQDPILVQTILSQGLPPAEARKQVLGLIDLVRRLGTVETTVVYEPNAFRLDLAWHYKK